MSWYVIKIWLTLCTFFFYVYFSIIESLGCWLSLLKQTLNNTMDSLPGGSGLRCCLMCKTYKELDDHLVCDSCWDWFEYNVDLWYVKGRGLVCSTGRKCESCNPCRLQHFWDLVDFQSSCSRCTCGKRTVLKGLSCSTCIQSSRGTLPILPEVQVPRQLEKPLLSRQQPKPLEKKGKEEAKEKAVTREEEGIITIDSSDESDQQQPSTTPVPAKPVRTPATPEPQLNKGNIKWNLEAIPRQYHKKAKKQLKKQCRVRLNRNLLNVLRQKPLIANGTTASSQRKRKRSYTFTDSEDSSTESSDRRRPLSSGMADYVNGIMITAHGSRQAKNPKPAARPISSPDQPTSPVLRRASLTGTSSTSEHAKLQRLSKKLSAQAKEFAEAQRKIELLTRKNEELTRKNEKLMRTLVERGQTNSPTFEDLTNNHL